MKRYIYTIMALVLGSISSLATESELTPTNLTIVVMDKTNKVLDCVTVPDDKESSSVTFTLPKNSDEIRVFVIGSRLDKAIPNNYYYTGRPKQGKWQGLGYVEVSIEKGSIAGINGNGYGTLKISDAMKDAIKKDLKEAKKATITTIKKM